MSLFVENWRLFLVVASLILEMTNASNLKWVPASNGEVPSYAVVGGENFSGEVLYVARVRLNSGWTPGKMAPSYKVAHTSYGGKEFFKREYEILTNANWKSHLEWKATSGHHSAPSSRAVAGGSDAGRTLFVARFIYGDGHMICGKALYENHKAYIGYNSLEYERSLFYVMVEHSTWYMRSLSKRHFPELPHVKQLKRAPTLEKKSEDEESLVDL